MKYRNASPEMRMLLMEGDDVFEGSAPSMGYAKKAATKPRERRMLVLYDGEIPRTEFPGRDWTNLGGNLWSAMLTLAEARKLSQLDKTVYFEEAASLGLSLCTSANEIALPESSDEYGDERPTGAGVVVGIIDDGIDIRHPDFLDPSRKKTRIKYLWNQDGEPSNELGPPEGFSEGVEYGENEINRMLEGEDLGLDMPENAHGTHVAAIAAGTGDYGGHSGCTKSHRGVASQADIIFVSLRPENSLTLTDSYLLIRAIQYIFAKADQDDKACVINISLGQNLGSHDGESLVEQQIDHYLEREVGRAVVIAAGNESDKQTHASGTVAMGYPTQIRFNNVPLHAAWQSTTIQIWYSSLDRISASVRCPHKEHDSSPEVGPSDDFSYQAACGARTKIDNIRFMELNGDSCITVKIQRGELAGGEWLIELRGLEITDGSWHAWVERSWPDENGETHQPRFMGSGTEEASSTLTTPSTARRAITVANYTHHETRKVYATSGRGPTRDGRDKPEIAAPGHLIWSASAGGAGDASRTQKTGTSMSAPHVTGVIALMFEKNPRLTARQIQSLLRVSAETSDEQKAFDRGWGYGRLNAKRALELTPTPKAG